MNDPSRTGRVNVKMLVIVLLVLGILGGGAGVGHYLQKRMMADRAVTAGRAAFEQKDWVEACKQFKLYLQKYPDDLAVLEQYCEANMSVRPVDAQHVGAAIGAYRRLLLRKPADAEISTKLARIYYDVGDYGEAAHICRQRLAVDGNDADALYRLGRALSAQTKSAEAAEVLGQLVEKHPDRVKGYAMLSGLVLQADTGGAEDTALEWLNRAVTANPKSSEALAQRARFQRVMLRDRNAALADLQTATALGFDDPVVQLFVAEEWVEWGELDKAADGLAALARVDPASLERHDLDESSLGYAVWRMRAKMALLDPVRFSPGELADQALAAMEGGFRKRFLPAAVELYLAGNRVSDAERCLGEDKAARAEAKNAGPPSLEELVLSARVATAAGRGYEAANLLLSSGQSIEKYPAALRVLSDAFFATGQPGRGREALRQYVGRVPQDRTALLRLAQAYRNDQWDLVRSYADAAMRLSPTLGAKLLWLEARMMLAAGRPDERTVFEELRNETAKLREQFPKDAGVRMLAAAAWSRAGSEDKAAAELSGAIAECEPKLPAELQLVDLYQRNGRMDEALAAARRLVDNHADVASPRLLLAELQRRAGRKDEAQTTLQDAAEHLKGEERFEARRASAQNLILEGKRRAAAELLATLASEHPSDAEIRVSLLSLPEVRSDAAEAARRIGELRVIEGDAGVRWKLEQARLWVESGEWRSRQSEAIELLQVCRRDDPGWEPPSLVLAVVHERLGNLRDAEQTLRDAMSKNPLALTAADRLVDLLKRQGRYAEAEQVLDRLPAGTEAFGSQRIDLATARGDYDEAIRRLELQVAAHPEEADAAVRLARLVFAARKDRSRAETLLAQAAARDPDSLEVLRARVSLLHTAGEATAALSLLDAEVSRLNNFGVYWLRARYMVETGRFDQAERDYEHLTTFVDQAESGYGLLAEFHESRGRRGDAIAALEAGLKINPENPALSRALMRVLIASDNAEDRVRGRERLDRLRDRYPDDPDLLRLKAASLLDEHTAAGDAQAKELLERVVSLNPSDAAAYQLLINQAREHREFERAASLVSRGLTTNPTNLVLQIARIAIEVDTGRNRVARELAQKVLDDHPSDLGVANQLTDVFRRAGDADSAALFSERALVIAPNDEYANIARAAALAGKGDAKEAMKQLSRFLGTEAGAGSFAAHLAMASIAAKQQEFAAAEAALLRADELAPGDAGVARERMKLLAAQARYDEVVSILSEIRANHGDDSVTLIAGGYALAAASGDRWLREARSAFEAAAKADPRNLDAHRGVANVTYRTRDIDAAIGAFRSLLNLSPDDAGALNDLAWILMQDKGEAGLVEAEQLATRGLARYPDDVHLLDTHGVILLHLRRYDDAKRDLEKCRKLAETQPETRAAASLHLAQVLTVQGGDLTAVRQLVEEALKIDKERRVLSDEDRAALAKLAE